MFNFSRARATVRLLLIMCLPLLCFSPGETRAPADDLFTQIFNRTLVKQRSMQSVRAHFTETTTSSLLTRPLVAHGTVIGANPARVLMTYTDPEAKTIAIDSKALTIAWPGRHEREKIDISEIQKRIEKNFRNTALEDLRAMFRITAEPDGRIPNADRIEMTPLKKPMKTGLARLDLWIDRTNDLLVQMRLTFPSGDQKTIALDDIVVNVPVTDEMFTIR